MDRQELKRLFDKTDRRYQTMLNEAYSSYISGAAEVGDALVKYMNFKNVVGRRQRIVWDNDMRYFALVGSIPVKKSKKSRRR